MNIPARRPARLFILLAVTLAAAPALAKDKASRAVPLDPGSWITAEDYPAAALKAGKAGVSHIRWDVTADGKAENCTIAESSGSPDLDQAACTAILTRAHYTPALDKKGRPARDTADRRVRWQMPIEQPDTSVPYTLRPF